MALLAQLSSDTLIKKMNLEQNLNDNLSRSDAVVLVDRMRGLVKSAAEKDMGEYYNPFADVPGNAEYLLSLMRLAYYRSNSFNINPIEKYNELFNPMHHTTREEFLKIALSAFDIPQHSYDLSKFEDYVDGKTNMSEWAKKFFETAVYHGIIHGNKDKKLLAKEKISIQEALWILARIQEKFGNHYPFGTDSYDTPDSLDISKLFHKTVGYEYEPRYYKPDATPIDISTINQSKNGNYYVLTVRSIMDTGNGASDYYWWSTDKGYFKEVPGNRNYKTVHFYPLSTKPNSDYHITVHGGDNLGYVDHATITIDANDFDYPEERKTIDTEQYVQANLQDMRLGANLISNKLFTVDLSAVSVKKAGIELGVDQVDVKMEYDGRSYPLFHGAPVNKKANFIVPDYPDLYGKTDVQMHVELYSQAEKLSTDKTLTYFPQFVVRGKVYNAAEGTKPTEVLVGGKSVPLDENGEFFYVIDSHDEVSGLEVRTKQNSELNHFDTAHVDLTYPSPSKYVVLIGRKDWEHIDTDHDGIPDEIEKALGLNPNKADSDNDGINDLQEVGDMYHPVDTDGDGIIDALDTDSDDDGISDADEIKYGFDPKDASDAGADNDGDGVSNLDEIRNGSNPNVQNSVTLQKLDDIYVQVNAGIPFITLHGTAGNGATVTYRVVSDHPDIVSASVDGALLSLTPLEGASGTARITVTAKYGNQKATQAFTVTVKDSKISEQENGTGDYRPVEESVYDKNVDGADLHAAIDALGHVEYHVARNGTTTQVQVTIPGAEVKVAHDGTATVTLPTGRSIAMTVGADGRITPHVEGVPMPSGALPAGTVVEAGDHNVTVTIPLPETLTF